MPARPTGRPLPQSEKRFNRLISKRRFRVEQCFGTMKRLFGLHRARYFGRAKDMPRWSWPPSRQERWKTTKLAFKLTIMRGLSRQQGA